MSHGHYVALHRKRWALKEEELANLLGVSQSHISRIEDGKAAKTAQLEIVLGLQVIFGRAPRTLFAKLYEAVEEAVMTRAAELDLALRDKHDPDSIKKKQLLAKMLKRATSPRMV